MKRITAAVAALFIVANALLIGSAFLPSWLEAQTTVALVGVDAVGNHVERSLGLVRGAAAANANAVKINAAIRNTTLRQYTLSFPAGDWYVGIDTVNSGINGTCIETARSTGQSFCGKGVAAPRSETDNNGELPTATRIIYAGPKVDLSETTHLLSGSTITFTGGHDVIAQDAGATLEITGGTGAATGFYVISSVNAGSDTWTLDRAPGGSATNLTGLMTYTLWRDVGYGSRYTGLYFKGAETVGDTKCHIGLHSQSDTSAPLLNVGKHFLEQCVWTDFTAAFLAGRDMRQAYDGAASYTGDADNHCDHFTFIRPFWWYCRTGFYARNGQSVCSDILGPRHLGNGANPCEVVYHERGGELVMTGGDFSGIDTTALRLGLNGSNANGFRLEGCNFDSESTRPKWLTTDQALADTNSITFVDCGIDEGVSTIDTPLWQIKGATLLVLDNCSRLSTDWIEMHQKSGGGGLYWTPHCEVRSCTIRLQMDVDTVEDVISGDSTYDGGTSEPMTVTFTGANRNHEGSIMYDNGRYNVGDDWVTGFQFPPP